jgi:hypothetical protein
MNDVGEIVRRLTAERDEWKKRAFSILKMFDNCADSNARLRAALEQIINHTYAVSSERKLKFLEPIDEIARSALAKSS